MHAAQSCIVAAMYAQERIAIHQLHRKARFKTSSAIMCIMRLRYSLQLVILACIYKFYVFFLVSCRFSRNMVNILQQDCKTQCSYVMQEVANNNRAPNAYQVGMRYVKYIINIRTTPIIKPRINEFELFPCPSNVLLGNQYSFLCPMNWFSVHCNNLFTTNNINILDVCFSVMHKFSTNKYEPYFYQDFKSSQ